MNNLIGFCSSDSHSLYIEDIYRSLALPKKSIIHFRYDHSFIEDDIVANLTTCINKKGIIFFVSGNNFDIPEKERKKEFHSIRKTIIKDVQRSENTGLVHFYLELGDFYDCTINHTDTKKFVKHITVTEGVKHKWIDRVRLVEKYFDDILFFKYEILDKSNRKVFPKYSILHKDAIYNLSDETEYILSCSFYDKLKGKSSLKIIDDNLMKIHYKESSTIAAETDDRQFKMLTRSINQNRTPLQIIFSPEPNNTGKKYEVVSFFEIKRKKSSIFLFGLYSASAFSAILLSQIFASMIKSDSTCSLSSIIKVGCLSLALMGFSGAMLYRHFNKK